ncbi:protein of unknown function DUF305 [Mycolicibacterium rhodesiae JS60]|nr:protein of unknown function DUF305 [Mycolicibacterium rhodesiae JS60]
MKQVKIMVTGAAAFAAVVAIGACSNPATKEAASSAPATAQSSSAAPAAAHNQADMMFAHMMIPHHQQAIEMSDVILAKQGIDPRVVDLAKQIKAAQGPEIAQMQGWLNQWGMPGMNNMPGMSGTTSSMPPDHGGMPMPMPSGSSMPGMPGMGDMSGMDGMMSPADMQALQNAQGVAASKLFLTQMIAHHQGAIAMAQDEIKNGQFTDAVTLAKAIATSQQKEIDTMNQILSSL